MPSDAWAPGIIIDDVRIKHNTCHHCGQWLAGCQVTMGAFVVTASIDADGWVVGPSNLRDRAAQHEIASRLRTLVLEKLAARWSERTAHEAAQLEQDQRHAAETAA